jgi:hypothetical protein
MPLAYSSIRSCERCKHRNVIPFVASCLYSHDRTLIAVVSDDLIADVVLALDGLDLASSTSGDKRGGKPLQSRTGVKPGVGLSFVGYVGENAVRALPPLLRVEERNLVEEVLDELHIAGP